MPRHNLMGAIRQVYWIVREAVFFLVRHEGLELSGYMSFTAILALFPFLIFVVALAGFVGRAEGAENVIGTIFNFAPRQVAEVLAPVVRSVIDQRRGDLLTIGIIFALWSASSGVEALRVLLNRSYDVVETRSIWWLRLQSVLFVILGALIIVTISVAIVLGPLIEKMLGYVVGPSFIGPGLWASVRYGSAAVVFTTSLIVLHTFLPNRNQRLREIWPGTLLTTLLWLIGAVAFSAYVQNLPAYGLTYGSLGGVILSLYFFYVSAIIFAFGAEINAALMRRHSDEY
jgi:membrane protein